MACVMCIARGKTWHGSDPKCAFENGIFSRENWNCATIWELREMADDVKQWSEDQYYAFIPLVQNEVGAEFLYLSWYKNRGRTEHMYLVIYGELPRPPTEDECRRIIAKELLLEVSK
jgi:hypothetical protein